MTYIKKVEAELTEMLARGEDAAAVVSWVSHKLMRSYKNGIIAGHKRQQAKVNRSRVSSEQAE